jgi:hypothetical protein
MPPSLPGERQRAAVGVAEETRRQSLRPYRLLALGGRSNMQVNADGSVDICVVLNG